MAITNGNFFLTKPSQKRTYRILLLCIEYNMERAKTAMSQAQGSIPRRFCREGKQERRISAR